jgi:hypothetical protein
MYPRTSTKDYPFGDICLLQRMTCSPYLSTYLPTYLPTNCTVPFYLVFFILPWRAAHLLASSRDTAMRDCDLAARTADGME